MSDDAPERRFRVELPTPAGADGTGSLFALEVGPADAVQTAIVLHGGPGASMDYLRPQLDALASSRRRLVYYDQRGSGQSLVPASWPVAGVREHVADLHDVVRAVGGGPPLLVGYSWGGLLALHFALAAPASIARLLLISPAPPDASMREEMRERLRASAERPEVKAFTATLELAGPLGPTTRRHRFAARVAGYFHDPRRALELTPFMVRERAERGVWDSLAGYDLRPQLPSLAVPTMILHGIDDPVPIAGSREVARLAPARVQLVELADCGHAPYLEAADRFFPAARAFLDG